MISPLIAAELRRLQARIARTAPQIITRNSDARMGSAVEVRRGNQRAVIPFTSGRESRRETGRFR